MPAHTDITALIAYARTLDWTRCEPRCPLQLAAWHEEWDDNLAMLQAFAEEEAPALPLPGLDWCTDEPVDAADAADTETELDPTEGLWQDAHQQWDNAAQAASTLLRLALDRGLPAQQLRPLYLLVVQVWQGYANWLTHARVAGYAHATAPIRTEADGYPFALQLLAMAILLDEPGEIVGIYNDLLQGRTDRLLDYLSAADAGLTEAREDWLHPEPFAGLNDFLEQYGDVTAAPLLPYLQQHYQRFFALPPATQARHPRLQGPQAWGWWALEVGALVVLYDLDDSALRDVPHYPADLVDFARGVRD